jgi:hypothetical protein
MFTRRSLVVALALVLLGAACSSDDAGSAAGDSGGDGEATTTTVAPEPISASTGEYADTGWEEHDPGPDCECADGSDFSLWTHEGDPSRVVLFFMGGGACFSPETCSFTDGTYTVQATDQVQYAQSGIFDFENPDNPFRDWSFVFVPYCTGDVHLGDADHDYGDGLVVHHKGYVNATAGMDLLVDQFGDAEHVFVTGSSAGGVPAPLFAGLVADELPEASVASLSDASGAYPDNPPVNEAIGGLWGTFENVPDWPENEGLGPADWSIPGLFVQAGLHNPDLRFARYDAAYDEVQQQFSTLADISDGDLFEIIQANEAGIEEEGVDVSSYIAPGTVHTILGDDALYTLTVEGSSLVEWLTAFVDGQPVDDVTCVDCEPPAGA